MFAHNNEQIDYAEIALCNALMIGNNTDHPNVALVTDKGTRDWLFSRHDRELIDRAFSHVIVRPAPHTDQFRRFLDTNSTTRYLRWRNGSRASAYDVSPFDETIVLDADYLIMDRMLDHCWGARDSFMMNRTAITLEHLPPPEEEIRLSPTGIAMHWATVIYFRKEPFAQRVFEAVEHVREHYDYYAGLYGFPGSLFRNDYAFSIAAHLVGGWTPGGIPELPCRTLLTSFDQDELIEIPEKNVMTVLVNRSDDPSRFRVNRIEGVSVHVMNKFSLGRLAPRIIEVYQ